MQSVENSRTSDKSSEEEKLSPRQNYTNNLDQPSPTSILDAQFEDDVNGNLLQTSEANARQQRKFSLAFASMLIFLFAD